MERYFFRGFLVFVCMFFAGCTQQARIDSALPEKRDVVYERHYSVSEEILTCLKDTRNLSAEQLEKALNKQKEVFIDESNAANRSRLICLSLARLDKSDSVEYAKDLMLDMLKVDSAPHPDVEGMLVLINKFQYLQQSRNAEIGRTQKQIEELKKKLEKLKSVEDIIKNRKNDY